MSKLSAQTKKNAARQDFAPVRNVRPCNRKAAGIAEGQMGQPTCSAKKARIKPVDAAASHVFMEHYQRVIDELAARGRSDLVPALPVPSRIRPYENLRKITRLPRPKLAASALPQSPKLSREEKAAAEAFADAVLPVAEPQQP